MTSRILLAVMIAALAGWGGGTQVHAQPDDFPRVVIDDTGTPVTIPARPAVIAAIGSVPALESLVPASDLRRLDPAGSATWDSVGLLVIPGPPAAYAALIESADSAGVPVYRVTAVTGLDAWRDSLARLGRATGRDSQATAQIARLDRRITALEAALRDEAPLRVLALTPEGYTFGGGTLFTDLITAAGGINVAAEAGFDDYRQVTDATILVLAPDVILLSPAWGTGAAAVFAANPAYVNVPAIRQGRVIRLPFAPTVPGDPGAAAVALGIVLHPAALLLPR